MSTISSILGAQKKCRTGALAFEGNKAPKYRDYIVGPPGGLPEFHHYQPPSNHPDWPPLFEEAHELAEEILPKLERPQRSWA